MEAIVRPTIAESDATGAIAARPPIPFDAGRLDALMEDAGIDALIVTSKHNIQYLLGGYRFFFFDHLDAIGVSRYLPILLYVKGQPQSATYIGHPMETYEQELNRFWVPAFSGSARTSTDGIKAAMERLATLAPQAKRIGIERAFLPADAESALRNDCPGWSSSKPSCRSSAFAQSKRRRNWKTYEPRAISSSIRCSRSWPAPSPP
jgi:Creatinase/Prolidase N-terminal domain